MIPIGIETFSVDIVLIHTGNALIHTCIGLIPIGIKPIPIDIAAFPIEIVPIPIGIRVISIGNASIQTAHRTVAAGKKSNQTALQRQNMHLLPCRVHTAQEEAVPQRRGSAL